MASLRHLVLVAPCIALLGACSPLREGDLDRADQDTFGVHRHPRQSLRVPVHPDGQFAEGRIDTPGDLGAWFGELNPNTHGTVYQAWQKGAPPSYGVLGRTRDVRALWIGIRCDPYGTRGFEPYLSLRALHPAPFECRLSRESESDQIVELARGRSTLWGPSLHYAELKVPLAGRSLESFESLVGELSRGSGNWAEEARLNLELTPY